MQELKIGEVYNLEGVTLGLVSKIDEAKRNAVVVCLDFPYFRLVNIDEFLLTAIKVADSSRSLVAQLTQQVDQRDSSVNAWESEVESLADEVLDTILEDYDEDDLDKDNDVIVSRIKKEARILCRGSEWFTNTELNDKLIKYSITYLDITPAQILMYVPEDKKHIWTAVRRGAALAHFVSDVAEKVWDLVDENVDDYEDDGDDDV